LEQLPGIRSGFFSRRGGVSGGIFQALNVSFASGDDTAAVSQNRQRIAHHLGVEADRLSTARQVHGRRVLTLQRPWPARQAPAADAIVTATPGVAIGVATADCAPILVADPEARVIAAAHAGWRGALEGILDNTVSAMEQLGAERRRCVAVIGPAISRRRYQVGEEFRARFLAGDATKHAFFEEDDEKERWRFDLPGYAAERLRALGIGLVADVALCTYEDEHRFFSYRRAIHRGERDYGRQLSAIVLAEGSGGAGARGRRA
jgi:YfiH family protein